METSDLISDSAASEPDLSSRPRSAAEWFGRLVLAVAVLAVGAVAGVMGPLLAIACDTCQDGVRDPLPFGEVLLVIAHTAVPLTTLGTVFGIFLSRRGARAGGIGLGILTALLILMLVLGRITA
ncbi:hypothetical protein AB0D04_04300 [Streptomyces sp. NPDC048483]|uniref:hypothetical protein n=1 Tax=Streptomyces sp. NPDC048483 TaxID=3154927 RepID=UPI0034305FE2